MNEEGILCRLEKYYIIKNGKKGRPPKFSAEWEEIINRKAQGYYNIETSGGVIDKFDYHAPNGHILHFSDAPEFMST